MLRSHKHLIQTALTISVIFTGGIVQAQVSQESLKQACNSELKTNWDKCKLQQKIENGYELRACDGAPPAEKRIITFGESRIYGSAKTWVCTTTKMEELATGGVRHESALSSGFGTKVLNKPGGVIQFIGKDGSVYERRFSRSGEDTHFMNGKPLNQSAVLEADLIAFIEGRQNTVAHLSPHERNFKELRGPAPTFDEVRSSR